MVYVLWLSSSESNRLWKGNGMIRFIIALILSASALSAAEHSPYITDKQISFFEEHRSDQFGVHGELVWYRHLGTIWGTTIQQYRIECSAEENAEADNINAIINLIILLPFHSRFDSDESPQYINNIC